MKKQLKYTILATCIMSLSSAYALTPAGQGVAVNPTQGQVLPNQANQVNRALPQSNVSVSTQAPNQVANVQNSGPANDISNPNQALNLGAANTFEKEVTPLLREISLKKSILELRKVERDIEKIDEEALKAQVEREQLLNPPKVNEAGPMGGIPLGNKPITVGQTPSFSAMTDKEEAKYRMRILMIYGYNDNLHAKVATGEQGGFVVKKGDIMPDGRLVRNITANFIEVQGEPGGGKKGKGKVEKIFVSYTPAPAPVASPMVNMPAAVAPIPAAPPVPFLMPTR